MASWVRARALLALSAIFLGGPVWAQPAEAPAKTETASDQWPAGSIEKQLDRDATMVPFGKGAIFVPSLTNPLDEPPVVAFKGGNRVAEGTTGKRIILSPGTYEVRVGSGASQQRLKFQATVRELHTTVLPVSWAGLTVHIVDEQYGSLRSSYELIRVEDREYMGIGFSTDEQAGEPISTWISRPGLYKIVKVGDNYRARRDFSTVRLIEGKHTHFLLVLNKDTGAFAGGGEVPEEDLFKPRDGLYGSLILGGDVSFNSRSNVVGLSDGLSFALRGFIDGRFSIELLENPLILQLQVEQGQTKGPDAPWQKTNDRVDFDGLYVYRLAPWIGPYIRVGAETAVLPGAQNFDDAWRVEYRDEEGGLVRTETNATQVDLSPSLGLTTLKEGIGINLRVFKSIFAEVTLRTGFGARHRLTQDLFEAQDGGLDPLRDSPVAENPICYQENWPLMNGVPTRPPMCPERLRDTLVYERIPSRNNYGVEATLLATARLTRWVLINLEVDTLVPPQDIEATVLEMEASVALKLTSYISVNYVLRYLRDRALSDVDRIENDVLLRFSFDLL